MNFYAGLLFQQGYIYDTRLALSLAGADDDGASPDDAADPVAAEAIDTIDTVDTPAAPAPAAGAVACKPYRRGAVYDLCSVALSPFR